MSAHKKDVKFLILTPSKTSVYAARKFSLSQEAKIHKTNIIINMYNLIFFFQKRRSTIFTKSKKKGLPCLRSSPLGAGKRFLHLDPPLLKYGTASYCTLLPASQPLTCSTKQNEKYISLFDLEYIKKSFF